MRALELALKKYDRLGRDDALTIGPISVGGALAHEVQAEATMVTSFVANVRAVSIWISGRGIRYLKFAYLDGSCSAGTSVSCTLWGYVFLSSGQCL